MRLRRALLLEKRRSAALIRDRAFISICYLEISEVIKKPTVELVKFPHFNYDNNYNFSKQREKVVKLKLNTTKSKSAAIIWKDGVMGYIF